MNYNFTISVPSIVFSFIISVGLNPCIRALGNDL